MKLQIVTARTGTAWVRQGIKTFWRQAFALSGLFFLFTGLISLSSLLSYVGTFLGLLILPGLSLGLMAAAREADMGRFPMPRILFIAFLQGTEKSKRMLGMGLVYGLLFVAVLLLSAVFDGGDFARMYLLGVTPQDSNVLDESFQNAAIFSMVMYFPLSALFWHAPALVHWHGQPVAKSLFFSVMACVSNWRAFLMFVLTWAGIFSATSLLLGVLSIILEDGQLSMALMLPAVMLLAAMFFTSSYFSFRACFVNETVLDD